MKSNLLPRVKLSVDTIYELTRNGWVEVSMRSFGDNLLPRVSAVLVKRNVLEHKQEFGGKHLYRWAAESEPTPYFYKSVHKEIVERQRKYTEKSRLKKQAEKAVEAVPVPDPAPAPMPEPVAPDLSGVSS